MKQRYVTKRSKVAGGKFTWLLGFFCLMAIPAWALDQGINHAQNQGINHAQNQGIDQAQNQGIDQAQEEGIDQAQGHWIVQLQPQGIEHAQGQDNKPRDQGFHLVDHVEIVLEVPGQKDTVCKLRFLEDWFIDPQANSILKQVVNWDSCCFEILSSLPAKGGNIPIRNISYEFHLLDPHLVASQNKAFPEPDSMDAPTRQLQAQLIALLTARTHFEERYQLDQQLLSVIFHEDWSINPTNLVVSKKVRAITPVIWQRRQTETGEPINEAETGLPVYYKIELQQITLRNP